MFHSIKSKITLISICIFIVFNVVIIVLQVNSYFNYKKLQINYYNDQIYKFKYYTQLTTQHLAQLSQTLAITGHSVHHFQINDRQFLSLSAKYNLSKTPVASGCGIWFEPNVMNNEPRFSGFAYRDNGQIKIEESNQAGTYNYFVKEWYYGTINNLNTKKLDAVYWSKPYPDPLSNKQYMITAGSIIVDKANNGKVIGVATADWLLKDVLRNLYAIAPTNDSIVLLANQKRNYIIALKDERTDRKYPDFKDYTGKSLNILSWYNPKLQNGDVKRIGTKFYKTFICDFDNEMSMIVEIPLYAIYGVQRNQLILGLLIQLIATILFVLFIRRFMKINLNRPIDILMEATKKIGQGDLDTRIEIKKPKEFAQLADTYNKTTSALKQYLEDIKDLSAKNQQIEIDLNVAHEIQNSAIPSIYPRFYNLPSIDISPHMDVAKKVGGDFYDFYFIDKDHMVFLIADVSEKGISAALFMMSSRTLLKCMLLYNDKFEDTIEKVNNALCYNNEQDFFITAGMGIIDLKTGDVTYINAGHIPPIIKRGNDVEYLEVPPNIVLGGFLDAKFEVTKFKLNPLDSIFLYTDGVTEARNSKNELYGSDRLLEIVTHEKDSPKSVINIVKNDLQEYTSGTEQADDITMLGIRYLGTENLCVNKKFVCNVEELENLKDWLKNFATTVEIEKEKIDKLCIAAEEIFVNICEYAYPKNAPDKERIANVGLKYIKDAREINLVFIDAGVKYNPLELPTPDTDLDISERELGGMGVYMVMTMMDDVEYEYNCKHNNLKLKYRV